VNTTERPVELEVVVKGPSKLLVHKYHFGPSLTAVMRQVPLVVILEPFEYRSVNAHGARMVAEVWPALNVTELMVNVPLSI